MPNQSRVSVKVVVAASLGGTKLAVGVVGCKGPIPSLCFQEVDWRTKFDIEYGLEGQNDEETRKKAEKKLLGAMATWMQRAFRAARKQGYRVTNFGVSTKGPARKGIDKRGEFVIVGPCTTLPFKECMLDRELGKALKRRGFRSPKVNVLHDGAAAALGERNYLASRQGTSGRSPAKTLAVTKNMVAVIIGTGIGVGVIQKGLIYEGINPGEKGDAYFRNLGSLGRHLVCVHREVRSASWPDYCRYQYRGAHPHHKYAPICKKSGEVYFTERVAGPWLADEIARLVKQQSQNSAQQARRTRAAMQLKLADINRLLSLKHNGAESKGLQKKILEGLTRAAVAGDPWARDQVGAVGAEIGAALGEFILAFRGRRYVKTITLVSTVSEKLGDGVAVNSTAFQKNTNDLLISRVQAAAEAVLSEDHVPQTEAHQLAKGIVRSLMGGDRELWAFLP